MFFSYEGWRDLNFNYDSGCFRDSADRTSLENILFTCWTEIACYLCLGI